MCECPRGSWRSLEAGALRLAARAKPMKGGYQRLIVRGRGNAPPAHDSRPGQVVKLPISFRRMIHGGDLSQQFDRNASRIRLRAQVSNNDPDLGLEGRPPQGSCRWISTIDRATPCLGGTQSSVEKFSDGRLLHEHKADRHNDPVIGSRSASAAVDLADHVGRQCFRYLPFYP